MHKANLSKKFSFCKKGLKYELIANNKPFLTPAKNKILLPLNLIKSIIKELNNINDKITPELMPVFSFCLTAIDKVLPNRQTINNEILNYFITDALFYRDNKNINLKLEQERLYDPVIKIFEKNLKVNIVLSEYTLPVKQSDNANKKMFLFINEIDDFELTVLYQLVNISSSLILSYLLFNKIISSEVFLSLSFLEENFQEAKWGLEPDSIKKKSAISKNLNEVLHFLELLH